jgi:hypothetical protein
MSRRFNYTGRKRLTRDHFRIKLTEGTGGPPSFTADVMIPPDVKLDPSARIYIEAYVGTSAMRFDFGTVSAISAPVDCVLTDIDANTPILFRVRVVDEKGSVGRILAAANGIRPESDQEGKNRKSLLPLRGIDLGEELWKLELDRDAGPTLAVNNRVPNLTDRIPADAVLMGAIYPEVVRQMTRQLFSPDAGFDESLDWVRDWRTWLTQQLGREIQGEDCADTDSLDHIANEVARGFSDRNRFASKLAQLVGEAQ